MSKRIILSGWLDSLKLLADLYADLNDERKKRWYSSAVCLKLYESIGYTAVAGGVSVLYLTFIIPKVIINRR